MKLSKSKVSGDVMDLPRDSESTPISPKKGIAILQNIVLCGPERPSTSRETYEENNSMQPIYGGYEQGLVESSQLSIPVMCLEDDFDPSAFESLMDMLDSNVEVRETEKDSSAVESVMDMLDSNVEVRDTEEASSLQAANKTTENQLGMRNVASSSGMGTRAPKTAKTKRRANKNVETGTSKLRVLLTKDSSAPTKRRKMSLQNGKGNNCKKSSVGDHMALEEKPVVNLMSESDSDTEISIFSQAEDRDMIKFFNRKRKDLERELQHQLKEIESNKAIVKTASAKLLEINNRLYSFADMRRRVTEGRRRIKLERRRLDEEEQRLAEEERGFTGDCLSLEQEGRQLQANIDDCNTIIHGGRKITKKILEKIDYFRKKYR